MTDLFRQETRPLYFSMAVTYCSHLQDGSLCAGGAHLFVNHKDTRDIRGNLVYDTQHANDLPPL